MYYLVPFLSFLFMGCSKNSEPVDPSNNKQAKQEKSSTQGSVQVDGATFPLKTYLAYSFGGEAIGFDLTTSDSWDCSNVINGGGGGENHIKFMAAPTLQPDGNFSWSIHDFIYSCCYADVPNYSSTSFADVLPVTVSTQGDKKQITAKIDQTFVAPAKDWNHVEKGSEKYREDLNKKEISIQFKGDFIAQDCGILVPQLHEDAATNPQDSLTVVPAGKTFPMKAATLRTDSSWGEENLLVLSTGVQTCKRDPRGSDLIIKVNLEKATNKVKRIRISGDTIPGKLIDGAVFSGELTATSGYTKGTMEDFFDLAKHASAKLSESEYSLDVKIEKSTAPNIWTDPSGSTMQTTGHTLVMNGKGTVTKCPE